MFVQEDFYQANPDVMALVMTQLSLKSGLKWWGNKQGVCSGNIRDEATTFPEHIQTKALEWANKDTAPDGVRISHGSQGEVRQIPQGKDRDWQK
jgi:hypothetical protein